MQANGVIPVDPAVLTTDDAFEMAMILANTGRAEDPNEWVDAIRQQAAAATFDCLF